MSEAATAKMLDSAVVDALGRAGLQPTFLCWDLLQLAAARSMEKRDGKGEVSCTGVFLASFLFAEDQVATLPVNGERFQLVQFFDEFSYGDPGQRRSLKAIADAYYDPEASRHWDDERNRVHVSATLVRAFEWSARTYGTRLDSFRLLSAVLHFTDTNLRRRLLVEGVDEAYLLSVLNRHISELGDQVSASPDADAQPDSPPPTGDTDKPDLRARIDRDPDDPAQLTPSVAIYAAALATILRTAVGEFCFGLFGQWGMGKTRLMRNIVPLLEDPALYKAKMAERGYAIEDDVFDTLRYDVVWYSAWKYRRPPEAWVFLYEMVVRRAMRTTLVGKFRLAIRTAVERSGYWFVMLDLLLLGSITVPIDGFLYQAVTLVLGALGLGGLVLGSGMTERGREVARNFAARYATSTRHADRLGLQALIGTDLRALLKAWVPAPAAEASDQSAAAPAADRPAGLAILGLAAFALAWLWAMSDAPPSAFPILHAVGFAAWGVLVACVFLAIHMRSAATAPDRILLIIDDLDRCNPSEVIDIAESLKLLLEDEDIRRRVQVVMLIDENILRHAISEKFADLIDDSGVADQTVRDAVVREHVEKLFTLYFRLPGLDKVEIAELTELFAKSGRKAQSTPEPQESPTVTTVERATTNRTTTSANLKLGSSFGAMAEYSTSKASETQTSIKSVTDTGPAHPKISGCALRFTDAEIDILREDVPAILAERGHASPRAIRMLLFKYQLCRLLLRLSGANGSEIGPNQVLAALGAAQNGKTAGSGSLQRVVAQVA